MPYSPSSTRPAASPSIARSRYVLTVTVVSGGMYWERSRYSQRPKSFLISSSTTHRPFSSTLSISQNASSESTRPQSASPSIGSAAPLTPSVSTPRERLNTTSFESTLDAIGIVTMHLSSLSS